MGTKWLMGIVAIVAVVAVGGIGFAAFTTSAYVQGSATAGTFGPLYWTHGDPTSTESFDQCSATIGTMFNTSDTLTLSAGNLAPGDFCGFQAHLHNAGTIPANVYAEITAATGNACGVTYMYDTFAPTGESLGVTTAPQAIGAGGSLFYQASLGIGSDAGNWAQGQNCTFTVTFSATVGGSD